MPPGLTDAQMQAIAAKLDLSETTFVLPPENPRNHARVRIFNRNSEMPFAGHPNVGTGYVLATMAGDPPEHYTFEQMAGLVRVHILRDPGGGFLVRGSRRRGRCRWISPFRSMWWQPAPAWRKVTSKRGRIRR